MSMQGRCVPRLVDSRGISAPNSADVDAVRRFLQARLPHGTQGAIALECGKTRARVAEEIEGTKALSLDVFALAVAALHLEDKLRVVAHVLEPMGLRPEPLSIEPIDGVAR